MVFDPILRKDPHCLGGIAHLSNHYALRSGLTTLRPAFFSEGLPPPQTQAIEEHGLLLFRSHT